ncbi:MAG TPA: dTMP kinase [Bacillota bacterium]|nr:dTMP kinase [Bacillota bacterium]
MSGLFITLEGGDGAGKTSIIPSIKKKLEQRGYDVVTTREPGGSVIAEKIRNIILDPEHIEMDARTEALLYAAARRQHLVEIVLPALEKGKVVLCDRFIDSSLAYQGYARGIGVKEVFTMNKFAIETVMPSLTLFFDITPEKGLERISGSRERDKDRLDLENIQFHERVYEAYDQLRSKYPERIVSINADQPIENVEEEAFRKILSHIQGGEER